MEEIREKFGGTWKLDRADKLDEFLKAVGTNFVVRKMAVASRPLQTITVNDEDKTMNIKTSTSFWSRDEFVKLNEEYEHEEHGIRQKAVCKYEDGKLIKTQKPVGDSNIKCPIVIREIINGEMVTTTECEDVVCKRWFKKMD